MKVYDLLNSTLEIMMNKTLEKAFEIDWETLPEENKIAYLTRWMEYAITTNIEYLGKQMYFTCMNNAIQNLS